MAKKKIFKTMLALSLSVMMSTALFAGCGKKDNTKPAEGEKKEVSIEFWTISLRPTFDTFFNDLIAKYEKDHPNVKVKWTDMPYDAIQNKLLTAVAGGNSPDVVNLNTQMALILSSKGALLNLDKEATDAQKSIYIKGLYESTQTKDGTFAFPWYGAPHISMYNKELFDKAGIQPPKTYDEMLSVSKTFKDKTGAYILVPDSFFNTLYLEGVNILNDDKTKAAFNTPEAVELLTKLKKAADDGIIPKEKWGAWDNMLKLFSTKKIGMINSGAQTLKRIKDEAPDVYKNIEITQPIVGKTGTILNPIMNLVVPAKTKNKKEAIDFANYVTNDENQLAFCKAVQIFPSTTKAAADPFFKSDTKTLEGKALSMVAEELPKTVDVKVGSPKQTEIVEAINKAQEAVILNNKDPKTALAEAEKKVNEVLAQK